MRGARFRAGLWIAGAILGLTLADACDLNPQPLPPESNGNTASADASTGNMTPGGSSGGSGGGSSGAGFGSSSGGSSSGSSSGAGPSSSADAGVITPPDGASAGAGEPTTTLDAGTDAGVPIDGASEDASPDAAIEDASPTEGGCVHALDCHVSHPGACALCPWPLNFPVCVEHQCRCACDERDAAEE
jgi:hypothetical protein